MAVWAEQDLIVHDEFRDGNVPAGRGNVRILDRAVASLPSGITHTLTRGDSALYQHAVLAWCEAPKRGIGYAVSADMSPQSNAAITQLPSTPGSLSATNPTQSAGGPKSHTFRTTAIIEKIGPVCGGISRFESVDAKASYLPMTAP